MENYRFKESQLAFEEAIRKGVLSESPSSPNYAGNYMYMHSEGRKDFFKNINTRQYINT